MQSRVSAVWERSFYHFDEDDFMEGHRRNQTEALLQTSERDKCQALCEELFTRLHIAEGYLENVDQALSNALQRPFYHDRTGVPQVILNHAASFISRLPPTASPSPIPPCFEQDAKSLRHYFASTPTTGSSGTAPTWENLNAASFVSSLVIQVALLVAVIKDAGRNTRGKWASDLAGKVEAGDRLQTIINTLAKLTDVASKQSEAATDVHAKQKWFIAKVFLWTSWQRTMSLFLWWSLDLHLFGDSPHDLFILGRLDPRSPSTVGSETSYGRGDPLRAPYMCSWAFELLRTNKLSGALDFRRFHQRFTTQFGRLPARCLKSDMRACDGRSPYTCTRFVGAKIQNQSMHDLDYCAGDSCVKLVWDEESYRAASGGRAVSLTRTDTKYLRYVSASQRTLAVSHVWSHGQGGRPETGFNTCLHLRYARIARAAGCDSYWMDTPCIPQDHQLRREAILQINSVFMICKVTLVCDRDLMVIDVSTPTIEISESILVTILVCDWNLRAWTMLEAFKAYRNIHVLCKDNQITSLAENLARVHLEGSIDVGVTFLAADHLIPRSHRSHWYNLIETEAEANMGGDPGATNSENSQDEREAGWSAYRSLHIDKAGTFLNHRHASRPGDEIVIWSLLCTDKVFDRAEDLWAAFVGWKLNTIFLISSAPRIQNCKGLSWAPIRPNPPPLLDGSPPIEDYCIAQDMQSEQAAISKEGLRGKWFVSQFQALRHKSGARESGSIGSPPDSKRQCLKITEIYLGSHKWGALLQAATMRPGNPSPIQYTGPSSGRVVAVVASDDCSSWVWRGVYTWNVDLEPLPGFVLQEILIA